ncbi:MAG: DUF3108 domain-containing protein [Candidatus Omnitrophica bacterium]|nr:DUF3108 domain-containing protein [Candidatus Omnitrophota bacterium]
MILRYVLLIFSCVSIFSAGYASAQTAVSQPLPFTVGETIIFDIKKLKITIGEAALEYKGLTEINGKQAQHIVFRAKATGFYDEENLYFDPQTFYPLKNFRDLNIFGNKQKIEETYFQDQRKVEIIDLSKDATDKLEIKKNGPIDNVYGIIYRFRMNGNAELGAKINSELPTKEVKFIISKINNIKINKQRYKAVFMSGDPKNFGFWFSDDKKRIPLKINGALGAISAVMEFKKYCESSCLENNK